MTKYQRYVVESFEEASMFFESDVGCRYILMCVMGSHCKKVQNLNEAREFFDVDRFVRNALAPTTIGELKEGISHMKDDLLVFKFEWGDIEGCSSWTRKKTWKQWVKEQKKGAICQSSKTGKSSISTSVPLNKSSQTSKTMSTQDSSQSGLKK